MRLWHVDLIPYLPRQQLLSQWRECVCIAKSLAEKGTPNHILVNRILDYSACHFEKYGLLIIDKMIKRGYKITRESKFKFLNYIETWANERQVGAKCWTPKIFENWHNERYFIQCFYNLQEKYDCGGMSKIEYDFLYNRIRKRIDLYHHKENSDV